MAVTLTSTGITFSDGTNLTTAPSAGGMSVQTFNNSGTWSRPSGVNTILAYGRAGSGQGNSTGYGGASPGGAGGAFIAEPLSVTGNLAVNIGNGGSGNITYSGYYSYSCGTWPSGNSTSVGSITANGGGGSRTHDCRGPGSGGNSNSITSTLSSGGGNYGIGVKGQAYIVW